MNFRAADFEGFGDWRARSETADERRENRERKGEEKKARREESMRSEKSDFSRVSVTEVEARG